MSDPLFTSILMALAGGVMIGLAATLLMAATGHLMGMSGILAGLFKGAPAVNWRIPFVAGVVAAPLLAVTGVFGETVIAATPTLGIAIAAGLIVGLGVRLGNGCTSGHGICGLARFSRRSLVATLTFMAAAMAVVFVMRHVVGPGA